MNIRLDIWGPCCVAGGFGHLTQAGVYGVHVVWQAGLAISRKLVYSNGAHMFRIYNLKDECSGSDAAALVNPQVLTRFALFLQVKIQ
jgi:hypothetical protein